MFSEQKMIEILCLMSATLGNNFLEKKNTLGNNFLERKKQQQKLVFF